MSHAGAATSSGHSAAEGGTGLRVVLASSNRGKLRELAALLTPLGLELVSQSELGVAPADEPHPSFIENALAKARHASRVTGMPAIADDSGICVTALGGRPGVRSARFAAHGEEASDDARNNARLLAELAGKSERSAHYYCALVFVRDAVDPRPIFAEGTWHGEVSAAPRGRGGFGYDPCFLLPELGCTAAELDPEHKNRISHRAQAMRALAARLASERELPGPAR